MLLANFDTAMHKLPVNTEVGFSLVLNIVIHQQRLIAKKISFEQDNLRKFVHPITVECK